MAEKTKRSQRKSERTTIFARVIWIVWTLVTGGSVAGWVAPDMPLVGPLMQSLLSSKQVTDALEKVPDTAWKDNLKKLRSDLTKSVAPTTAPRPRSRRRGDQPDCHVRGDRPETGRCDPDCHLQHPGIRHQQAGQNVGCRHPGEGRAALRHRGDPGSAGPRGHDPAQLRRGDQRGWQPL